MSVRPDGSCMLPGAQQTQGMLATITEDRRVRNGSGAAFGDVWSLRGTELPLPFEFITDLPAVSGGPWAQNNSAAAGGLASLLSL